MLRSSFVSLSIRCALALTAGTAIWCAAPAPAMAMQDKAADTEFKDAENRFTCSVPAGWTVDEPNRPQMVAMFNSAPENEADEFNENVNIVVVDLGEDATKITLDDLVAQAVEGLKSMEGVKVGEITKGTLGGGEARQMTMSIVQAGMTMRSEQTYAIHGTNFYVITYTTKPEANAKIDGEAQSILTSWKYAD